MHSTVQVLVNLTQSVRKDHLFWFAVLGHTQPTMSGGHGARVWATGSTFSALRTQRREAGAHTFSFFCLVLDPSP